jgi:signal peptidase I
MSGGRRRDDTRGPARARGRWRVLRWMRDGALTLGAIVGVTFFVAMIACTALNIRPLVFLSGSMSPTIDAGSLAFAQKTPSSDLKRGDIVSVITDKGSRVTHRIVAIDRTGATPAVRLKGDANPVEDRRPYIIQSADRVMFSVPYVGFGLAFISSSWGLFLLGVGVTGLLGYAFRPGLRRRGTRATALAVVPLAVALSFSNGGVTPTYAYFTDQGTATSGLLATYTVPKPAEAPTNPCTTSGGGGLGVKRITTSWVIATPPTSKTFTYTAVLRETSTNLTVNISSGIGSAEISTNAISLTLGATYHIDVTVALSGTVWTATSTRTATLGLLGLGWTCGSWT